MPLAITLLCPRGSKIQDFRPDLKFCVSFQGEVALLCVHLCWTSKLMLEFIVKVLCLSKTVWCRSHTSADILVEAKGAASIDSLIGLGESCGSRSEPSLSNFLDSVGECICLKGEGKQGFKEDHNLTSLRSVKLIHFLCRAPLAVGFSLPMKMSGVFSL